MIIKLLENNLPHQVQQLIAEQLRLDSLNFLKEGNFAHAYYGLYWDEEFDRYVELPPSEDSDKSEIPSILKVCSGAEADFDFVKITWLPFPLPESETYNLSGAYIVLGCGLNLKSGETILPGSVLEIKDEQIISLNPLSEDQEKYWNKPSTLLLKLDYKPDPNPVKILEK